MEEIASKNWTVWFLALKETECDEMKSEGMGLDWTGLDGMGWNGMEWNGMEWDGMGWNGMGGAIGVRLSERGDYVSSSML